MPPKKKVKALSKETAYEMARDGKNPTEIIEWIRNNPTDLTHIPVKWSILHQVIYNGDVNLLKSLLEIPQVYFPLNYKTADGKSVAEILQEANEENNNVKAMEEYIELLQTWDQYCELAKNNLETKNQKLWAWLRTHASLCYIAPPSRRWSIAMQIVFSGNVERIQTLFNICPPPSVTTDSNVWLQTARDGQCMYDVAKQIGGSMLAYAKTHVEGTNNTSSSSSSSASSSIIASSSEKLEITGSLEQIIAQWKSIKPAIVSRGNGVCPILSDDPEPLFSPSRDCAHAYGSDALKHFIQTALHAGPFPVRCPGCTVNGKHRGIITRSSIKGLVKAKVITELEGQRLLLQQCKNMVDEASVDLQYSMSRPCPFCTTPIAHYKGHGCHHIAPGGGCPNCKGHFCYICLGNTSSNPKQWGGCPNQHPMYCSAACDCPICPECTPGHPCDVCDGAASACPVCRGANGDSDSDDDHGDY